MPIVKSHPPRRSWAILCNALDQLASIKEGRKRWTRLQPAKVRIRGILYCLSVYNVDLRALLGSSDLDTTTMRRVAWMYLLRDPTGQVACAEVSIVARKHRYARLSEGRFVSRALRTIEKARKDPRLRKGRFQLRSLRADSLHIFALWLKASDGVEHWIAVTPIGTKVSPGKWLSRQEFVTLLKEEAERIAAAHERASRFARKS